MSDKFIPHGGWLLNTRFIIGMIPIVVVDNNGITGYEVGMQVAIGGGAARVVGDVFDTIEEAVQYQSDMLRLLVENVG